MYRLARKVFFYLYEIVNSIREIEKKYLKCKINLYIKSLTLIFGFAGFINARSIFMLDAKTNTSPTSGIIQDDEAFLRAILSNRASVSTTTTAPSNTEVNPAALLALLLKQQGIEPSTPAINLREQLQLAVSKPFSIIFLQSMNKLIS